MAPDSSVGKFSFSAHQFCKRADQATRHYSRNSTTIKHCLYVLSCLVVYVLTACLTIKQPVQSPDGVAHRDRHPHATTHSHTRTHNTQWLSPQVVLDLDLKQPLGSERLGDISYQ